jgi:hypothetical protein
MPYLTEFSVEDGVLHVQLAGQFPPELLRATGNVFTPVIDACATHGCFKVLIDARHLEVKLDTVKLFRAGVDAALASHRGLRLAFVARDDMLDGFFEEVARNRGALIGVFTEFDRACEWLAKQRLPAGAPRPLHAGT